jgi:tetratricopeptide (TPR) repeat protein
LAGAALLSATAANAADALKFGPPPAWVVPQSIPQAKPSDAAVAILLKDEQVAFDSGKITTYSEGAIRVQGPQGLAAGNLSLVWDPSTETITVNKLHIIRGGKVIDVLASGQTFTTLRRETNLDAAMLDGALTANIQPEGLQDGDIIDLATTTERSDPVLKGHVETTFAAWNGLPILSAHAALSWPQATKLTFRQSDGLPPARKSSHDGRSSIELAGQKLEPIIPPKGAPLRFQVGRIAEATDFASWADVAALMAPLYKEAASISASGPLHDEVERIRSASTDPKVRAQQALALVQSRVRYVALEMGSGGYVPAAAETTWSRRFGDCKGKTALLLAMLHSLGIQADAVLVQSSAGDIIADRLPLIELFDHVLVRARIADKDYWLDGTRVGDTDLESIEVPDFGWALPLVSHAQLVHLVPRPLDKPESETTLEVNASDGVYATAPATAEQIIRGDAAVAMQTALSSVSEAQRNEFFQTYWSANFDFITFKSGTFIFDKDKRELRLRMTGDAKLDWSHGVFEVPDSSLGYHPNFERQPGPFHDAPFAVAYPSYKKWTTRLRVPQSFLGSRKLGSADIHETLAGVEYSQTTSASGDTVTVESSARSIVPEVSYAQAKADETRLAALDDQSAQLPMPRSYRLTAADVSAKMAEKPTSAEEYSGRGQLLMDAGKFDEAVADFTAALAAKPNDEWYLANRGIGYVWKQDFAAAEKDLNAAAAINPDNPVVLRARGLMAERKGEWTKAIDLYTRSLSRDSGDVFAIQHRATCESALAKYDEALADSALALKGNPSSVEMRLLRANIFLLQGNSDAVAQEAKVLVEQERASDYALVAAARIYAKIGRNADALKAFDAALAIKPLPYIYVNRAQSRPFTDHSGRLADLDAALKLDPNDPDALAEKAEEVGSTGDYQQALQLYDRVMKANPKASYYNVRRAIMLYKSGHAAEAKKLLDEQRVKANAANDFNSLCWAKATAGILLEEALEDCRQALKLAPEIGTYIDSLALVELRLGRVDDAIADYDRAIARKSGAASYMGRAIAYAWKGDKAHADLDLAQALKLDSDERTRFEEFGLKLDRPSQPAKTAEMPAAKD